MDFLKKLIANSKFEIINTEPFQIKRYTIDEPISNDDRKKLITAYKVYNEQLKEIISKNNQLIDRLQNEMT